MVVSRFFHNPDNDEQVQVDHKLSSKDNKWRWIAYTGEGENRVYECNGRIQGFYSYEESDEHSKRFLNVRGE